MAEFNQEAETGIIFEYSGNIEKSLKLLDEECEQIRQEIEEAGS